MQHLRLLSSRLEKHLRNCSIKRLDTAEYNQKNFTIFEKHSIYAKQKDPSENDGSFFSYVNAEEISVFASNNVNADIVLMQKDIYLDLTNFEKYLKRSLKNKGINTDNIKIQTGNTETEDTSDSGTSTMFNEFTAQKVDVTAATTSKSGNNIITPSNKVCVYNITAQNGLSAGCWSGSFSIGLTLTKE